MEQHKKKLIEVDLPLDEINRESAREKSIRHGHPSTLHLWWARRPLAACRAVIFASMVDDPSSCPDEFPTEAEQHAERERLHDLIRRLVKWESTDEREPVARSLIAEARFEIARCVARSGGESPPDKDNPAEVLRYLNDKALPIYDPFAGGGSIPLEAQRLGLRAVGTDLNPVAVLINKALIELPPKFANKPPVNPDADPMGMIIGKGRRQQRVAWRGAAGLADDIRYYGQWMREKAFERIGHLYPKVIHEEHDPRRIPRTRSTKDTKGHEGKNFILATDVPQATGSEATVIAWLFARTVPCPNPACGVAMPLMKTFQLSKKRGNEHWTRPVIDDEAGYLSAESSRQAGLPPLGQAGNCDSSSSKTLSFVVQDHDDGVPKGGTVNRNGATCVACRASMKLDYVREQARAGNMGEVMTAIVAEGNRKRLFLSPTDEHIRAAADAEPAWRPLQTMPDTPTLVSGRGFGITHWHQLFTDRQLTALTTFSDLIGEIRTLLLEQGASAQYADAICTYLALAIGRVADSGCSFATWQNVGDFVAHVFARQAIPMVWDFAEANPFSDSSQNWMGQIEWIAKAVERLPVDVNDSEAHQADASTTIHAQNGPVIVTDPPYYDNIDYADLSDFFYVWLRPLLRDIYPELFAGILTPKNEEMTAIRSRFDDPRERFEDLLNKTLKLIRERCSPEFPSSIFYAYKQQEGEREGRTSTGWETMLSALVNAGFQIIGTWPMRTERSARSNALSTNSLASSVVLVCRPRAEDASVVTRRQFLNALERELPEALAHLTRESHIAPTDLAQAAIGPGMQIYSRYRSVETIGGEPVPVRAALAEINRVVAEYHRQEQGDLDAPSQFCMDWLRQYGYGQGRYGDAEVLAQAKNVSVDALALSDLLTAGGGRVTLLPLDEYGPDRPLRLPDMTAWEGCFRMAYHLNREDGEGIVGSAGVARAMGSNAESVARLARVLYAYYDRKGDSPNAVIFNHLVASWEDIRVQMQTADQETLRL